MRRIQFLLVEMKRRNVLRAAAFYAASTWLLVQIATQVFPFFHVAEWVVRWIVFAALIGFPLAMLLSWFYEWTPQGFRRDNNLAADAPVRKEAGRKLDRAIITVLALVVVALVADRFVLHRDAAPLPGSSIAVLPLLNESGDPKDEYFSDGLSEELTSALTRVDGLTVMGRNSAFQFKHSKASSQTIGEQLAVASLLEGSVRRDGGRVRIVASLINAADGRQLWSETYDGELDDVFALQSEIARAVADALRGKLFPGARQTAARHHVPNFETYDHVLRGTHILSHGGDIATAVSELSQAVAMDPVYAEAWELLAMAESFSAEQHPASPAAASARRRAMAAAQRSVELDPQLSSAYAARGYLRAENDHDWDGALIDLRKSVRLDPNDSRSQLRYGYVLAALGRLPQAAATINDGIKLDALSPPLWKVLAWINVGQGDLVGARRATLRLQAINADATGPAIYLGMVSLLQGDVEVARTTATKFDRQDLLAMAEHDLGHTGPATRALEAQIAAHSDDDAYSIAQIYAWTGDNDQAFEWLDRAIRQHESIALRLKYDPLLRGLHADIRFNRLLKSIGLPGLEERA